MNLAKYIDHTILKPDASRDEVEKICNEAKEYGFASVCVNVAHTKFVSEALKDSDVKTCTVVGFPLGAVLPEVKAYETKKAVENGSDEIDMVINIGALKDQDYELVERDIKAVVTAAEGALVKVIFETCLLSSDEIVKACELSMAAGADFVKTSTGFSTGGATVEDVTLMKQTIGNAGKVKASGGIRDYEQAMKMIEAGAERIGASAGIAIVKHEKTKGTGY
ncbi:deoxyribose-phosphate aldolase [Petrocella atlantisensis]|uniref:Deoxyribose-phosphate aldolase n=1 Tax=Petrocella atlantisensis TaxID=2173034 RepID=A0A3P7P9I2_9FIRM|nr:deoxyribose-phosphate aldolase [Petrocella atlantisensis]VDN46843.1 deoxyribose-phosphate aldolase [Petrocella atlantisensis]